MSSLYKQLTWKAVRTPSTYRHKRVIDFQDESLITDWLVVRDVSSFIHPPIVDIAYDTIAYDPGFENTIRDASQRLN